MLSTLKERRGRHVSDGAAAAMDAQLMDGQSIDTLDASAKRRQIMEGARTVFLASGFDGASMNDVARVAGVSKGTLYVYFESKEQLFEALVREERRQQAERLTDVSFESNDVRAVLLEFGCRLIGIMSRPDTLAHVRIVIGASQKFPQLGRAFYEAGPCFGANRLSSYMYRMNSEGVLRIADVERAAWQFLELCQAGTFKALLFRMIDELTPAQIEAGVSAAVEVFMAAYGARAQAANAGE
jgi:AcrR family transcriptional regulator